jgi:hypothetical protein
MQKSVGVELWKAERGPALKAISSLVSHGQPNGFSHLRSLEAFRRLDQVENDPQVVRVDEVVRLVGDGHKLGRRNENSEDQVLD